MSPRLREHIGKIRTRCFGSAVVRERAGTKDVPARRLNANEVILLFSQVVEDGPWTYWHFTTDGYAHSSNVQPGA